MAEHHRSQRSTVKRLAKRGVYDPAVIHQILDEGLVCHVGFAEEGQPFVIPTIYVRIGSSLYLHGSPASRMLNVLAAGASACITVTIVDGLVLARSAFHHSINYRSVVVFGSGSVVAEAERKQSILHALSEHLIRGRWIATRIPNADELRRTMVVGVAIDEASAKVRTGPPIDDDEDYVLPHWAGVLPYRLTPGLPVPDPRLTPTIAIPEHVANYRGPTPVDGLIEEFHESV